MILVKSTLGPSAIHGIGLFAEEPIKEGTKVWEFAPGFDLAVTKEEVEKLSEPAREDFFNYAYLSKHTGRYILCSDDARFFNHDPDANTTCHIPAGKEMEDALVCHATRDIQAGEELTNNYGEFDEDPYDVV
ncbi:MAG: uncharacterized protein QOE22_322 [Candidatus Parcubacteria bacterium]|jgi:SET domain-containing protein|nr:uncharacterized protein [Candidatus Parcubacteria bacterium]